MIKKSLLVIAFLLHFNESLAGAQTDRPYQELGRAQHFNLVVPGYILGIEKRSIFKRDKNLLDGLMSATQPYEPRFIYRQPAAGEAKKPDPVFKRVTSTLINKVMLVTQITKSVTYDGNNYTQYLYNAYDNDLNGIYNYADSFSKVDVMFSDMASQLKRAKEVNEPFTHLLVMSMGWNNDQAESLYRYNTIVKNVQREALANQQPFKPMVICFTWPSVWGGVTDSEAFQKVKHLASYVNKPDDADEIGYTWANWVVNKKIPETLMAAGLDNVKPKVVLMGHSFGARLLSRALFSAGFINPQYPNQHTVDVFLGLQGAFSLRRFVADAGNEGSPYTDYKILPGKIVLTASSHDTSNLAALWAVNAGGLEGLIYADYTSSVFNLLQWNPKEPTLALEGGRVNLLNASNIVKNESAEIDAHNDILDADMAKLIWAVIR